MMPARIDFGAVKAVPISAVVGASIALKRVGGGELAACCPFHPDRTPSFTVNDAKGFAHCFGCGWHGDSVDFLRALHGVDLREAVAMIDAGAIPQVEQRQAVPRTVERDTIAEAVGIWRSAGPAEGTPVSTYLAGRGLTLPIPPTIRFARLRYGKGAREYPALVALVASIDNKAVGVQRTFLREDGSGKADVPKPKLSLGSIAGAAIRLAPAAGELIVTEGLEDGLTLQQELGRSVWVAAGATNLAAMRLPALVRSVVIGADNDSAGRDAAARAAGAFTAAGQRVRIMRPPAAHKDFNEQLRGEC